VLGVDQVHLRGLEAERQRRRVRRDDDARDLAVQAREVRRDAVALRLVDPLQEAPRHEVDRDARAEREHVLGQRQT